MCQTSTVHLSCISLDAGCLCLATCMLHDTPIQRLYSTSIGPVSISPIDFVLCSSHDSIHPLCIYTVDVSRPSRSCPLQSKPRQQPQRRLPRPLSSRQLMLQAFFLGTDPIRRQGRGVTMVRGSFLLLSTICQSCRCRHSSPHVRDISRHWSPCSQH